MGVFLRRCWRSGSNADISTLKLGGAGGRRYTQRVAGRLFLKHRNPLEAGRPGERTTPVAPRGPADKLLASLNCRFDLGSFLFWRRCDAALPATAAATAVATAGGQGYGATHEGASARAAGSVGFGRRLDRRAQISGRPRGRRRPPGGRTGSAEESSKRKRARRTPPRAKRSPQRTAHRTHRTHLRSGAAGGGNADPFLILHKIRLCLARAHECRLFGGSNSVIFLFRTK